MPVASEQYQHVPAVRAAVQEQARKNVALLKQQAEEREAKRFKRYKKRYKKDLARAIREAAEEEAREANEVASAYAKKAANEGAEAAQKAAQQVLAEHIPGGPEGCCEAACDAGLGECLCLVIEPACECFIVGFCEHGMRVPPWLTQPLLLCVKCAGRVALEAAKEAAKVAQKKLREKAARDMAKRMRKAVQKMVREQLAQAAAIGDIDLGMDAPDVQQLLLDAQALGLDAEAIVADATAAAQEAVAAAAESLSGVREAFQTKFRGRLGEKMRKRQALLERADKAMFDAEYEAIMAKVRVWNAESCCGCCCFEDATDLAKAVKAAKPGMPGWNEGPYGVHVRPDTLHHFVDMDAPGMPALGAVALGAGAAALGGVVTQQPLPSGAGGAVGRGARVAPAPPEPSTETMVLTVPADWTLGTPLRVQTPRGRTLDVAVPAGLDPGAEFRVTVAAEPGSAFCTKCGTALSPGTNSCVKCDGPQPSSCTTCGASVAPDAKFCSSCGAVQPSGCPKCGAEVAPDAKFCTSCGAARP